MTCGNSIQVYSMYIHEFHRSWHQDLKPEVNLEFIGLFLNWIDPVKYIRCLIDPNTFHTVLKRTTYNSFSINGAIWKMTVEIDLTKSKDLSKQTPPTALRKLLHSTHPIWFFYILLVCPSSITSCKRTKEVQTSPRSFFPSTVCDANTVQFRRPLSKQHFEQSVSFLCISLDEVIRMRGCCATLFHSQLLHCYAISYPLMWMC